MISIIGQVAVYLLSLPLGVLYLSSLLGLVDERPISQALIRVMGYTALILLFLILVERSWWLPMTLAFATVLLLHVVAPIVLRTFFLGVPRYEDEPASADVSTTTERDETPREPRL